MFVHIAHIFHFFFGLPSYIFYYSPMSKNQLLFSIKDTKRACIFCLVSQQEIQWLQCVIKLSFFFLFTVCFISFVYLPYTRRWGYNYNGNKYILYTTTNIEFHRCRARSLVHSFVQCVCYYRQNDTLKKQKKKHKKNGMKWYATNDNQTEHRSLNREESFVFAEYRCERSVSTAEHRIGIFKNNETVVKRSKRAVHFSHNKTANRLTERKQCYLILVFRTQFFSFYRVCLLVCSYLSINKN